MDTLVSGGGMKRSKQQIYATASILKYLITLIKGKSPLKSGHIKAYLELLSEDTSTNHAMLDGLQHNFIENVLKNARVLKADTSIKNDCAEIRYTIR